MHAVTSLALPGLPPGFLRGHVESSDPHTRPDARRREGLERAEHDSRARAPHKLQQPEDTRGRPAQTVSASLSYQRSERTSLFLTTQEGDTVELKIRSHDSASLAASQLADGETVLSELELRTTSATRISLSVEGDLNADELAAIRSVFEQVGAVAQDFFDGDLPNAFAAAQALTVDATQLASVGLKMSMREQLTYSQRGALPALAPSALPPPAATAQLPTANAVTDPAATGAVPDSPLATAVANAAAPDSSAAAAVTDPAAATVTNPPPLPNALDLVRGFLTHLMERLTAPAPGAEGLSGASIEVSLKLRLFQSMVTAAADAAPASTDAAAPLPALVPETLEALAAQQDPPLHATV